MEDSEFNVHRCILSSQSEVFKKMFNNDFKDATHSEIELKDDKYASTSQFLKLIYATITLFNKTVEIDEYNILGITITLR